MTRSESLSVLFGRVYGWLVADAVSSGVPGWRGELERQLSLAMADETSRGVYQYALRRFRNHEADPTRVPRVWPHDLPLARVLAAGWAGVDDRTLACVGLNLLGVEGLAEAYRNAEADGGLGKRWWAVLGTLTPEERSEAPANLLLDYKRKFVDAIFQDANENEDAATHAENG